jgi:four helix bundle protein
MKVIKSHRELEVYQLAFQASMKIYVLTKSFPREELYSLTDQIRRSSRSVSANISEAFRRRKYPKAFCNKLNESESEAAETQNWLDYSLACSYISKEIHSELDREYENIIGKLVNMQKLPEKWTF